MLSIGYVQVAAVFGAWRKGRECVLDLWVFDWDHAIILMEPLTSLDETSVDEIDGLFCILLWSLVLDTFFFRLLLVVCFAPYPDGSFPVAFLESRKRSRMV